MNIVIFGGAFNPPHLGHSLVIQQAFELIPQISQLWLLPAYRHTFQKHLAPTNHRLKMTKILLDSLPDKTKQKTQLETIEIDQKLSGETYQTLKLLKKNNPDHQFSFLMGSDNLRSFKKWGQWEKLLEFLPFYIYPRAGHSGTISFPNMTLLESDIQIITNISSTTIRRRLTKNLSVSQLLHPKILSYIQAHNLY